MPRRSIGRAGALAAVAVLLFSGSAFADTVAGDGDLVSVGVQSSVDLGTVAPGATINRDVNLTLSCSGLRHVDPGQVVTVEQIGATVPSEGGSISATSTTIGPVPPEWANDTAGISGCAGPMDVNADGPSHVTIVAPPVAGTGYAVTVTYGRSLSPAGVSDASSITGFTSVTFSLAVADADTSPPAFTAGAPDLETTTNDPAGVAVGFDLPVATDDRDPQPVVGCDPASGSTFPIGVTTVTCTATDATGNAATESFTVTVHLASVSWGDPLHATDLVMARGRSLPVKVQAWLDGTALAGDATLVVTDCGTGGGAPTALEMTRQNERWMVVLDTSTLGLGCHRLALIAGGLNLGSFGLELVAPSKTANAISRALHRPS